MHTSKVLILLGACVVISWAYPTTVPPSPEVCSKMTPGHGPSPKSSPSPYTLDVSTTEVKGGNNVQVTLDGNGHTFKGFYVQARDSSGNRIGTFIPDPNLVKVHACGGIKNSAAHHSGKDDKDNVVVVWKSPQGYNGQVTFVATIVEEFESFWTNVKSEPVTITSYAFQSKSDYLTFKPHTFIDSKTQRTTPTEKSSKEDRILKYNPYSPFSPLRNGEFDTKQFIAALNGLSNYSKAKENSTLEEKNGEPRIMNQVEFESETANSRIRKSYYIPTTPVLHHHLHIDSQAVDHGSSAVPIPVSTYDNQGTRYTYSRGEPPIVSLIGQSSSRPTQGSIVEGGFHYLASSKSHPTPSPSTIRFHDQSSYIKSSQPHFRPSYYNRQLGLGDYINSNVNNDYDKSRPGHSSYSVSSKPISSTRVYHYQNQQHGLIVNDYNGDENIDAAIVLPKNMQSFDIPKYGYLIFNPKRGPPYYIIPSDTHTFERAHFGLLARSNNNNQPF